MKRLAAFFTLSTAFYAGCSTCTTTSGISDTPLGSPTIKTSALPAATGDVTFSSTAPAVDDEGRITSTALQAGQATMELDFASWDPIRCDLAPIAVALAASGVDLATSNNVITAAQTFSLPCSTTNNLEVSATATGVEVAPGTSTFTLEFVVTVIDANGRSSVITVDQNYAVGPYSQTYCPDNDQQGALG
jgi:hypothetical protein